MRERICEIIGQACAAMGVHIVKGVLARDHVHMFISVPPQIALSKVMQRIKGRSSRRVQMEFPELRKRYWGRRFWARGYFSITSGNVTDDIILQYLEVHSKRDATGVSRRAGFTTTHSVQSLRLPVGIALARTNHVITMSFQK